MNNENAPEVTAPERLRIAPLWPEGASWADAKTFVGEPGPANEGTAEYVLASKADAQADELRAEVERLKVKLGWAESREQNAVSRAADAAAENARLRAALSEALSILGDVGDFIVGGGGQGRVREFLLKEEASWTRPAEDFDPALQEGVRRIAEAEGWVEPSAADCLAQLERMAGAEFPNARAALSKALETPADAKQEGDDA
jgi:hypothetical protein